MKKINIINKAKITSKIMLLLISAMVVMVSCDDFTNVGVPVTELNSQAVFEQKNSANAAMTAIYVKIRDGGMLTGKISGMSVEMGLYTDELAWYGSDSNTSAPFYRNAVLPSSRYVEEWWRNAYSAIYDCNALLEGVAASEALAEDDKNQLMGEARFVRALMHFYLLQVYGEVPYITTTDYNLNKVAKRMDVAQLYEHILLDLTEAVELLPADYFTPGRVRPDADVAKAYLARVHLHRGDWAAAADYASAVLLKTEVYDWEEDLNAVFLKESTTAIWQFGPRNETRNTDEGTAFIFNTAPPKSTALSNSLMQSFEAGDQRKEAWTRARTSGTTTWYHAYKYKKLGSATPQVEVSVVMRLAELYLIRAEARAHQGFLTDAQDDVNKIRHRAGLSNTSAATKEAVLAAILQERRVEFFTEQGHRFMDLKRAGKIDAYLTPSKPGWNSTDHILPLPTNELKLNPQLLPQNPGY